MFFRIMRNVHNAGCTGSVISAAFKHDLVFENVISNLKWVMKYMT